MEIKITLGKVIWTASFLLFLIFSYGQSTFERAWEIVTGQASAEIEYVQELTVPSENLDAMQPSESESTPDVPDDVAHLLEMEKLKWEFQLAKQERADMKIKIAKLEQDKGRMFDDLLSFVVALMPLLVPVVTYRLTNHGRELFKGKA